MQKLFNDDLSARTKLAKEIVQGPDGRPVSTGRTLGVDIVITCPECGTPNKIRYFWPEIQALLSGQQVQGVVRDPQGWRAQIECARPGCTSLNGKTTITYRVGVGDFKPYLENLQGRAF